MAHCNVCRCCLAQGLHKDLNSSYLWLDKTEIYADMMLECFSIVLSPSAHISSGICDTCVSTLRASLAFKRMVLQSEQELITRAQDLDIKPKVKVELTENSGGDDSDDYFLADAGNGDVPKITIKKKKTRTLIISPECNSQPKVNLMWTAHMNLDKRKHKDNLRTILQYSNVLPFKNKSLLGYMCGYCDATYPDPVDLRAHTEADHEEERLNFKSNFDMTEYNVQVDISDLTCTLCNEKMENLNVLKDHLVKIHKKIIYNDIKDHIIQFRLKKGDVYDCIMCSATYETFKMLKQHMNVHYGNYTCSKCDSAFATKRSLNAHRSTHQEGSFKCEHCEKVFASRAKKQYHEKTKHLGARNISNCPFCNEPFRSYYQRNQHLVKVHNSEAQYKCNVCNKAYILKSLLMYHIKKNHLMERNAQCTECGYRFFSKKALKAHMVKHTGERNYQCEVCQKSYARKYTLREHMRIHNNDRRFKCAICSMSFVQKCSLKSHLLSNHGISMAASDITTTEPEKELPLNDASKDS
ncbi:zinc finger protein 658B-like isoform X2 [Pectinophora gossypiella]|uniref:zinc finger protein 658B-like isoform X2 n=1 Tax=Pectinophora gossypiella TaxID=13191 RepID=UPI00214EDFB7|nr:zinc finger protein 658B-like isoform X2 [Pectinophora gossypiella]